MLLGSSLSTRQRCCCLQGSTTTGSSLGPSSPHLKQHHQNHSQLASWRQPPSPKSQESLMRQKQPRCASPSRGPRANPATTELPRGDVATEDEFLASEMKRALSLTSAHGRILRWNHERGKVSVSMARSWNEMIFKTQSIVRFTEGLWYDPRVSCITSGAGAFSGVSGTMHLRQCVTGGPE